MSKNFLACPLRLRGRVGCTKPDCGAHGLDGKFFCEISAWTINGLTQVGETQTYGPFDSDAIAHEQMNRIIKLMGDVMIRLETGDPTSEATHILDYNADGIVRPWRDDA